MTTRPYWIDPFSPEGTREATAKILTGMNYRLFYESATRRTLIETYRDLRELASAHPSDDEAWRSGLKQMIENGTSEDKRLREWLIGLTRKTAINLGLKTKEYPSIFNEVMSDIEMLREEANQRDIALLLWCGAATLTIRGSQKSKIGKSLERAIVRAALTIIGLNEDAGQFRINIDADEEVGRETDAEVQTPRGFLRIEVGLIGSGNTEVISDKVGRMDRNSIILTDYLSAKSTAYQTAEQHGVRLVQLRHNHAVEEVRQHLHDLKVPVQLAPISVDEVEQRVRAMPLDAFS